MTYSRYKLKSKAFKRWTANKCSVYVQWNEDTNHWQHRPQNKLHVVTEVCQPNIVTML